MSVCNISMTMDRIANAPATSPIAVFRRFVGNEDYVLDSVFANTVLTQAEIKRNAPYLIGVFTSEDNLDVVKETLRSVIEGSKPTDRLCMSCKTNWFKSYGNHHRMCNNCKSERTRADGEYAMMEARA